MNAGKTGEIWIGMVDCINVSILVVMFNFIKCYHWGNWVKGTREVSILFLTISGESQQKNWISISGESQQKMWISIKKLH